MLRPRSTYTPRNAQRFKPIMDRAIRDKKNLKIKITGSPTAFQIKCSDALKWLVDYHDKEHIDSLGNLHHQGSYASLRGTCRFRFGTGRNEGYILLVFSVNEGIPEIAEFTEEEKEAKLDAMVKEPKDWRAELLTNFIEPPSGIRSNSAYILEGIKLSTEEQRFAEKLLGSLPNCIFDVSESRIVAQMIKKEDRVEGKS